MLDRQLQCQYANNAERDSLKICEGQMTTFVLVHGA
jgi:hypothetical protein